jgi:hypothetical protein
MSLSVAQTLTAVAVNLTSSFSGVGGTPPYTYSVRPLGAGGTIDSDGTYTAPSVVNAGLYGPPKQIYDTIQVIDSTGAIATAQILVGDALLLFCDIIQNQLGLKNGRVYLWDQKINQPDDAGLYVAVQVLSCKPFGNSNIPDGSGGGLVSGQSVNMYAQLQVDIISRNTEARDRKEEVIMALVSDYARQQMAANSFYIGSLPPGAQFVNLSDPDGAAIPYRFNISVSLQYFFVKNQAVPYFDQFATPQVVTNP